MTFLEKTDCCFETRKTVFDELVAGGGTNSVDSAALLAASGSKVVLIDRVIKIKACELAIDTSN